MLDTQYDVYDFMNTMGQDTPETPYIPEQEILDLRIKLIDEEVNKELIPAIKEKNLFRIADGIADSVYVLWGLACALGIDMEPIWAEVHRTNMQKTAGPLREDGKRMKPVGWTPPDIRKLIEEQINNK